MEERVARIETDMESIKAKCTVHEKRLDKHGEEIDSLADNMGKLNLRLELIQQSSQYTADNVKEIKEDIKDLKKFRESDHYIEPLAEKKRITTQVITLVVAFLVGLLLKTLFPGL